MNNVTHFIAAVGVSALVGCSIEPLLNKVMQPGPYVVPATTQDLHDGLWVADLHSDSLLWNRDLNEHGTHGHVDLPRLLAGGVDFFVASTVSKTPWGLNMDANDDKTDMLVANSMLQGWPARTWSSLMQRVLYQGEKLKKFAAESNGKMLLIGYADELSMVIERQQQDRVVGTMLATEGGHVLEGDLNNIDVLFEAGFRMMGLVHFFDNKLGGSAHGMVKGGLEPFGAEAIRRMESIGMLVDLAHASGPLIDDVLKVVTRPVVVSHTGVVGTCESPRNLNDDQLRAIAKNGGIIGLGMFKPAVCELSYTEVAKTVKYIADLIGIQYVALGSDFDGAVPMQTDISGIALLTKELQDQGIASADIAAVMGGNMQRFLLQNLPSSYKQVD